MTSTTITAAAVIALSALASGCGTPDYCDGSFAETSAFVASQQFVRRQLRAPSTARFPNITDREVRVSKVGECSFRVSGYVDAQNAFGGTVRTRYVARVRPSSDGRSYTLEDLSM